MRIVYSWRHALNTHLEDKKRVINVNETNGFSRGHESDIDHFQCLLYIIITTIK